MRALLVIIAAAAAGRRVHAGCDLLQALPQWIQWPANTAMNCAARPDAQVISVPRDAARPGAV